MYVINTLTHRAKAVCSTPQLLKEELHHLEEVLMRCRYPKWVVNKVFSKHEDEKKPTKKRQIPTAPPFSKMCHIVVLYSQGLCESYKSICNKYGIQLHIKGGQALKHLLVSPKEKDTITKKNSVIYWSTYDKIECEDVYTGESCRTFWERYREHLKAPSPITEHQSTHGLTKSV